MTTEALADLYHAGGLTELAVSVLKEEIMSRRLDWTEFTAPPSKGPISEPPSEWRLWRSRSKLGQIDSGDLSKDDKAQPTERSIVGIAGWLFLYLIKLAIGVILVVIEILRTVLDLEDLAIAVTVLIIVLIGLYMLVLVRKPITRHYHIGINCLAAALYIATMIVEPFSPYWLSMIAESVIWTIYWKISKRVHATYQIGNPQAT